MTAMTDTLEVALPGLPAIEGIRARRLRDDADYERLARVIAEANEFDAIPWVPSAENLRVELEGDAAIDRIEDVILVEVGDRPIAQAQVWRVVRDGRIVFEVNGSVAPDFRRRGLGRALLMANVRRAEARAALEPAGVACTIGAFAEEQELGNQALLRGAGFELVRHFFLMRRPDLATVQPIALPAGLEIRPVTPDQHRRIFDAESEAFRDHWDHREWTDDDFRITFARPELDTSLWVVAWDGDEVAGVVQTWIWASENERFGVSRGWLEHISVGRPWRRRGLARAISAEAMLRLRDRGIAEAMLGVDSENPTGALGLYEGLGFEVHSRAMAYRRPVDR